MDWFDNKEFWNIFYSWMFSPSTFDESEEQSEDIIKLTGINSGKVLDLCCGPGRHSIPLKKKGYDITAVDLHKFLLDKARSYSNNENLEIEFILEDMRSYNSENTYDLIINMDSSFGYFKNPNEDYVVLENIYHSLKKGGKLLIDIKGKEIHAMENKEFHTYELPNGDLIIQINKVRDGWNSIDSKWVYITSNKSYSFPMHYNLYSGAELRSLLIKSGFKNVRLYGDIKGSHYDQNAKRLVAVGDKKY